MTKKQSINMHSTDYQKPERIRSKEQGITNKEVLE